MRAISEIIQEVEENLAQRETERDTIQARLNELQEEIEQLSSMLHAHKGHPLKAVSLPVPAEIPKLTRLNDAACDALKNLGGSQHLNGIMAEITKVFPDLKFSKDTLASAMRKDARKRFQKLGEGFWELTESENQMAAGVTNS